MKIYQIKRLTLGLSLFGLIFSAGCEKMDDIQKEFVQRGETVYTAKADSLKVFAGNNRLQLSWLLLSDPKIHKYKVFWNNRRDSIVSTVVKSAGVDTVRLMMAPLPEGTYHFEVFTFDKLGNSSVKATIIGKVFGERYASSLLPRTVRKRERIDEYTLDLEWTTADEDLAQVELEYQDRFGALRKVKVGKKAEFTQLTDFPLGGSFRARSAFLPEKNALDTFFTATATTSIAVKDTVYWEEQKFIFGHLGNLIAIKPAGDFLQLDKNGSSFKFMRRTSGGWQAFNTVFSLENGVAARLPDGVLRFYPLNIGGTFGAMKVIGNGFQSFTQVFAMGANLLVRKATGELMKYPFNTPTIALGAATQMPGGTTWNQYDKILAVGEALIGRKPDGSLWRIPVNTNNTLGTAVKIAAGWNQFNLMANHNDGLIVRNAAKELWYYPIQEDGTLAAAKKIFVVEEVL